MKHKFFYFFVPLLLGLVSCNNSSDTGKANNQHRYDVSSGEISYKLNGMQEGYETLYFDQWGVREARYTKATLKIGTGLDRKVDRLIVTNKEWIYTIDFVEKTGTKMKNPAYEKNLTQTSLNPRDLSRINGQKLHKLGGQKTGQEQVADLPCEVWEVKRLAAKFWIWKQLVLKRIPKIATERSIMREAVRVNTGQKIPADKFEIPKDIVIQDLSTKSLRN